MAFESGRALYPCFICREEYKWFKMMTSEMPCSWVDDDPETLTEAKEALAEAASSKEKAPPSSNAVSRMTEAPPDLKPKKQMRVCKGCELKWRMTQPERRHARHEATTERIGQPAGCTMPRA